jgi:hypothetical protein
VLGWIVFVVLVLSVLMKDDGAALRAKHRRARLMYQAAKRQAQHDRLPPATKEDRICRAPPRVATPVALPDFAQDVETALLNREYSKKEAKQAVQRATGDDFGTRLKNALEILRLPDAKLTA